MADANFYGSIPGGLKAGAAITLRRFVKVDSSAAKQCIQAAAGTDMPIGVALQTVATGNDTPIQSFGIAQVEAGAAVALGVQVAADASGRAVTVATGNTPGGIALEAAGAAGDIIAVLLHGGPNLTGPTTP